MEYILYFREKSIFILIWLFIIYAVINKVTRKGLSKGDKIFAKNAKAINKNKAKIFNAQSKNGVMEYSIDDSIKHGYRNDEIERPLMLKRKGKNEFNNVKSESSKIINKKYSDALKREIPLSYLKNEDNFKNKTLRVYVEDVMGSVATLRDTTAIYELDLKGVYSIAGEFVLINIDKKGENIAINYILIDF